MQRVRRAPCANAEQMEVPFGPDRFGLYRLIELQFNFKDEVLIDFGVVEVAVGPPRKTEK